MEEFDAQLSAASASLQSLVDGPGQQAAGALEQAFTQAGSRIEQALGRAARSGELDFRRMADSVLSDLARIAAEAVIAQAGLSRVGQTVNLNMSVGPGADAGSIVGSAGSIARAVAAAAAKGSRFA